MDEKFREIAGIIFQDGRHNMVVGGEDFDDYWERKREVIIDKMLVACRPPLDPEYVKWIEKINKSVQEFMKKRKENDETRQLDD